MIDPRLQVHFEKLISRRQRLRFWTKMALCWAGAALLGAGLILLQHDTGWRSPLSLLVVVAVGVVAALIVDLRHVRARLSPEELAREIESRYPELAGLLLTAVQQRRNAAGEFGFLQERVIRDAARHAEQVNWGELCPQARLVTAKAAHWASVASLVLVLVALSQGTGQKLLERVDRFGIVVTPGDTSLEKGNTLVVIARFHGPFPSNVDLVVNQSTQAVQHITLVKSLSDPMFGGSVAEVATNFTYHIEYAGTRTREFAVNVFEHPRLERADADLDFPEYTGLPHKRIEDTRRITAVEGSRLDLNLKFNKPVASARLVGKGKTTDIVPLSLSTNRSMASLDQFNLGTSGAYDLQLTDTDGRTNKVPARFVFEAVSNRPPELRLTSPRGDLRPSPLEEVTFEGTAWDDFGVRAYGLGYNRVGAETVFVALGKDVPARQKQPFRYLLKLEELGLQPDQLISWFVWADDIGPDGLLRRTIGDLYFAEVRPFEEVFREGQGMPSAGEGSQSEEQGSQSAKLVQLEKQIILASWKLKHGGDVSPDKRGKTPRPGGKPEAPRSSEHRPPDSLNQQLGLVSTDIGARRPAVPTLELVRSLPVRLRLNAQVTGRDNQARVPARTQNDSSSSARGAVSTTDDLSVLIESQSQALEQARATLNRQQDPRTAALWTTAVNEMEQALDRLKASKNSPALLSEALAGEQAAYQALLKVQEHEYQVQRQRNRSGQPSNQDQQMERQLEQMDLTQSEDRYETQRQAQQPQNAQRREQLQVLNRLAELARRQQDLNERLKELQTSLQEARTEQDRAEIRRRLKRLEEEERQMLADADELKQRMDQPENQSRMSEERQQLEQTRQDIRQAADAAARNAPSEALASGTRAQRQLEEMRDQMRKQSSSEFADDVRSMRAQARELARRQDEILKKLQSESNSDQKSLAPSPQRQAIQDQLSNQSRLLTNLVERATQVSQQAEQAEPLLSKELYDGVRKFTQQTSKDVKELQEQMLKSRQMTPGLYEQFQNGSQADGAKLLDLTSEMVRSDFLPQAIETGQRTRSGIEDLKRAVEHAAQSIVGDDTESLRLARDQLEQLTEQLSQELAKATGTSSKTNQGRSAASTADLNQSETNGLMLAENAPRGGAGSQQRPAQTNETGRAGLRAQGSAQQGRNGSSDQTPDSQPESSEQAAQNNRNGGGRETQTSTQASSPGQNIGESQAQAEGAGQSTPGGTQQGQRSGTRAGRPGSGSPGGAGGDAADDIRRDMERILRSDNPAQADPLTGGGFVPWSDGLREVEELIDDAGLRSEVAVARERSRAVRQEFKREGKKPDWAVVRSQILQPLVEVRAQIAEELAHRDSREALVPIDRDPVPDRYSDLVRRYYERLGKDK